MVNGMIGQTGLTVMHHVKEMGISIRVECAPIQLHYMEGRIVSRGTTRGSCRRKKLKHAQMTISAQVRGQSN